MIQVLQKHAQELPGIKQRLAEKYGCTTSDPQLANLKIDLHIREPVRIAFPPPPTESDPTPALPPYSRVSETRITGIAAGPRYSLACSEDGSMYAWGVGTAAQLGLGKDVESAATPTRVRSKTMKEYVVLEVDARGQHALVRYVTRFKVFRVIIDVSFQCYESKLISNQRKSIAYVCGRQIYCC